MIDLARVEKRPQIQPNCVYEEFRGRAISQVAEDFVTWLDFQTDFVFNKQARVNTVSGYSVKRLAGVEILLTISTMRPQNNCVQPLKED